MVQTVPGVGPDLVFCVTVAGQTGCSFGPVAAYAPPVVTEISGLPPAGATGAGGDLFTLTCVGLGPLTVAGAAYLPLVSYGGPSGLAIAASCSPRSSGTAQTTMQCRTAQGAGGPYSIAICVGLTGQCGTPSATANITYAAPVVSAYRGPLRLLTVGGENLVIAGAGFGTAAQVTAGLYAVSLFYGPTTNPGAFAASSCTVQTDALSPTSTVISCVSVPGTGGPGAPGTTFGLYVVVGGATSAPLLPAGFGYAAPVVTGFSGVGAVGANTLGGDAVVVSGTGFGTNPALLSVVYTFPIVEAVPGVTTLVNGTFSPASVQYRACA